MAVFPMLQLPDAGGGQATNGLKTVFAAAVATLLLVFASAAYGDNPPGTDFRVSNAGVEGDSTYGAFQADAAYNPSANEYLVVWYGDYSTDEEFEIWGRRVSATGDPIGNEFQISQVDEGDATRKGLDPAVAYNPTTHQYLVAWYGNQPFDPANPGATPEKHYEIWSHLVSETGDLAPGADLRLSTTVAGSSPTRAVLRHPAVAADPQNSTFLVTWSANPLVQFPQQFAKYEIFGQLVNATTGAETGPQDFRISNTGADADNSKIALLPAITYNSTDHEYLVVWYGNGLQASGEFEIFGQRVSTSGAQVPDTTDFRISNVGQDGNGLREPSLGSPAVAHNVMDNQYLVTWTGNNLPTLGEYEVWGQRLSNTGAQIPDSVDFRISNVGTEGDKNAGGFDPDVAYSAAANEYLVAWFGNAGASVEACGQRVSATGQEIGQDFLISNMDAAGDGTRAGFSPDVVYNTSNHEYFAAWEGDGDRLANDEFEIFASRLESSPEVCQSSSSSGGGPGPAPAPGPSPTPRPSPPPTKALTLTASASSTQRLRSKTLVLRASCDQACTLTASARITIPGASKSYRLKSLKRSLGAGKRVTLRFKLAGKVYKAAKRALAKRKRVSATVNLIAKNPAGGQRTSRHVIRFRR